MSSEGPIIQLETIGVNDVHILLRRLYFFMLLFILFYKRGNSDRQIEWSFSLFSTVAEINVSASAKESLKVKLEKFHFEMFLSFKI